MDSRNTCLGMSRKICTRKKSRWDILFLSFTEGRFIIKSDKRTVLIVFNNKIKVNLISEIMGSSSSSSVYNPETGEWRKTKKSAQQNLGKQKVHNKEKVHRLLHRVKPGGICSKTSAWGWYICQFFLKRLTSLVFQYFPLKYVSSDSYSYFCKNYCKYIRGMCAKYPGTLQPSLPSTGFARALKVLKSPWILK